MDVVRNATGPLSAHGVHDRLRPLDDGIHVSAIFRALGELAEAGAIRRIESSKGYVADHGASIAMLCHDCGSFAETAAEGLHTRLTGLAKCSSFTPGRLVVEVVGRCEACAGAATQA